MVMQNQKCGPVLAAAALVSRGGTQKYSRPQPVAPVRNTVRRIGRNEPCPCGSGKKVKKCCLQGMR